MEIKDLAEVNAEIQEKKERKDNIDFKMVTFSLSGKDYGVDIMNIKEIAKADKFTYVPNASGFVRGVYNLRGDIIPIIDLRRFFHLPVESNLDKIENMLILHIEDRVYGTIVDKIDKVVGVSSTSIQPPHPIFGDINIKYISGVVEQQDVLYIILDVVRIFSPNLNENKNNEPVNDYSMLEEGIKTPAPKIERSENDLAFIKDGLGALKKFYASIINEAWIETRLNEWRSSRSAANIQFKNEKDAEEFLSDFYSPWTGRFWSDEYAYALKSMLPEISSGIVQVWNLGCGNGCESFSLACILKLRYPDLQIKIWANDSDIMAIVNAPNMVFAEADVPEYCRTFLTKGKNGFTFSGIIKDSIIFEYHDVTNPNTVPAIDVIVARDLLSFLSVKSQEELLREFDEKLKKNGLVVFGKNEVMPKDVWKSVGSNEISAFVKI
ncbi:MAG: chemotaxis protein CheW [Spirochaetaceae bacterium]|nr:chemotaxis protein CheW [Spirochaetaceae bacterium]